jgi:methionyl-tRNA formyltransferase
MKNKIVLLLSNDEFSTIIYQALQKDFHIAGVLIDAPVSKKKLIKGRIRRLGFWYVFFQLIFQVLVVKLLKKEGKKRIEEIKQQNNLSISAIPDDIIKYRGSVNTEKAIEQIKTLSPDLVFVNGTRILSKKLIQSLTVKMINMHAGITPNYRGVHGAYWALYNEDYEHVGTTIHYIDAGIDTGKVIMQRKIEVTSKDNFATYPYLQVVAGVAMLKEVIKRLFEGEQILSNKATSCSHLYYHPTIFTYLKGRLFRQVK